SGSFHIGSTVRTTEALRDPRRVRRVRSARRPANPGPVRGLLKLRIVLEGTQQSPKRPDFQPHQSFGRRIPGLACGLIRRDQLIAASAATSLRLFRQPPAPAYFWRAFLLLPICRERLVR